MGSVRDRFTTPRAQETPSADREPNVVYRLRPTTWAIDPEELDTAGSSLVGALQTTTAGRTSWAKRYGKIAAALVGIAVLIVLVVGDSISLPRWLPYAEAPRIASYATESWRTVMLLLVSTIYAAIAAVILTVAVAVGQHFRVAADATSRVSLHVSTTAGTESIRAYYLVDLAGRLPGQSSGESPLRETLRIPYDGNVELPSVPWQNAAQDLFDTVVGFPVEAALDDRFDPDSSPGEDAEPPLLVGEILFAETRPGDALQAMESARKGVSDDSTIGHLLDQVLADFSTRSLDACLQIVIGPNPDGPAATEHKHDLVRFGRDGGIYQRTRFAVEPTTHADVVLRAADKRRLNNLRKPNDEGEQELIENKLRLSVRVLAEAQTEADRVELRDFIKSMRHHIDSTLPRDVQAVTRTYATDSNRRDRRKAKRLVEDFLRRRVRRHAPGVTGLLKRTVLGGLPVTTTNVWHLGLIPGTGDPQVSRAINAIDKDESATNPPPPSQQDALTGDMPDAADPDSDRDGTPGHP